VLVSLPHAPTGSPDALFVFKNTLVLINITTKNKNKVNKILFKNEGMVEAKVKWLFAINNISHLHSAS
jgi:hypothetical protein